MYTQEKSLYTIAMKYDISPFLEKYYTSNDPIILGCSTGPDSMFLLYKILETPYKKNLVACYFNHKTRPESDEEEAFLIKLWEKEWFQVEVAECDFEKIQKLYPSKSFEELAREKRYQFFEAVCNIHKSSYIMTAHHLDDRIETFMFNMLRGSKLTGLINMTENSGNILRPLLKIEKKSILEHLDTNNLQYFIDSTNTNTDITRNKLRLDILPQFLEVNTNYKWNLSNIISYFEEVKNHLDTEVQVFLWDKDSFLISDFNALSVLLQKEVIRYIYFISNNNSTIGLSESNIEEVIRFINGKNNKTTKEIRGLSMRKDNKTILF